jgi:gliding motility associated protien GldN
MKKIIFALLASTASLSVFAQAGSSTGVNLGDPPSSSEFLKVNDSWKPSLAKDGIIDRVPHVSKVIPWQTVRENDVLYSKKVWREIDVRQKQNFAFRYPGDDETGGGTFIEILLNGIKKGEIRAFNTIDDRFTTPISYDNIMASVTGKPDTMKVFDPVTGNEVLKIRRRDFKPENVTRYQVKEQVIFDRNLGRERRFILGICAVVDDYDEDQIFKGIVPMFWIPYSECRTLLAKYEVYNPDNDLHRITWDDFFEQRRFSSYVTKSTFNNYDDVQIGNYKDALDRQLESERIKEQLFNKEQDLWVY